MAMLPVLSIIKDGEELKSLPISGESMLGRGHECVIRLEDRAISRQHAVFRPTADGVQVEKRSDFAPLMINGSDCTSAVVREGDVISIGPYIMRVKLQQEVTSAESLSAAESSDRPVAPVIDFSPRTPEASSTVEEGSAFEIVEVPHSGTHSNDSAMVLPAESGLVLSPAPVEPAAEMPSYSGDIGLASSLLQPEFSANSGEIALPPAEHEPLPVEGLSPATGDGKTQAVKSEELNVKLIFQPGAANYEQFELTKDEVVLGRDQACDVVLNDKKASRKHVIIRRVGAAFTLKDLNSANGTYLNGKKVTESALSSDDILRIGSTEFSFKATSAEYSVLAKDFIAVSPDEATRVGASAGSAQESESSESAPAFDYSEQPMLPADAAVGLPPMSSEPIPTPATSGGGGAIPGLNQIPGANAKSANSLLEKFRALPKVRQYIWIGIIVGLGYFLLIEDDTVSPQKNPQTVQNAQPRPSPKPGASGVPTVDWRAEFAKLGQTQKDFVKQKRDRAQELFKKDQFDEALAELSQIFTILPDYEDARELERFCQESKRQLAFKQEEAKRRAEKEAAQAKLAQLVQEVADKMAKQQYGLARDLFPEVKKLDPENAQVQIWEKQIQDFEAEQKAKAERERVQKMANDDAWSAYKSAISIKNRGECHSAIVALQDPRIGGGTDKAPLVKAKAAIADCHRIISEAREPAMVEGKQLEDAQDFSKSFQAYERANHVDPGFRPALEGMERTRKVLHDRAKGSYTEAVLAESYSDFETASAKYKEVLTIVPPDDIYFERATRKLSRIYLNNRAKAVSQ